MSQPYAMSWNQPPVFPGGVPPMPQGANIPASAWSKGTWASNPHYRPTATQPPQAAWAPGAAWAAHVQPPAQHASQQQQQQVYNPYKKQAKPPSAEYMAQKISDNGLQLEGMQTRSQLGWGGDLVPTPYVWNPANLPGEGSDSDDDQSTDEESSPSPSHRDNRNLHSSQSSASRHRTDPVSASSASGNFRSSQSSSASRSLTRHASEPPPDLSRSSMEGSRGYSSASQQAAQAALNRSNQRPSSASTATTTPPGQSAVPEAYTSRMPLKPTFSPNIIRTPEYYSQHSSPSRSASAAPSRRSTDESFNGMSSSMDRMSMSSTSGSTTLGRQSSLPLYADPQSSATSSRHRSSLSGAQQIVDEPTEMLSPLIIDSTPKPSSRPLARGGSMPTTSTSTVLSPISEARPSASQSKIYQISHEQNHRRNKSRVKYTPPGSASAGSRYQTTPPSGTSGSGQSHNPLPAPPQESSYINSIYPGTSSSSASAAAYHPRASSSASAAAAARQQSSTTSSSSASQVARQNSVSKSSPPTSSTRRIRHGYWNKRAELASYPGELEGFKNHRNQFMPYSAERRELSDSLPQRGMPPKKPYQYFLKYVER
ncbi:hypothetical protein DL96DRAFT_926422 [Flagelloscypha sp. PMI_526]|nr:hypothetical protein DL96DRAFT_926422 [Flagelloscypha sp. PMI_526]